MATISRWNQASGTDIAIEIWKYLNYGIKQDTVEITKKHVL